MKDNFGRDAETTTRDRALFSLKLFHRRTGAEQVPIAVDVVDAANGGPEFMVARPRRGESCLFARVRAVPFVGGDLSSGVRRVFE